MGLDLLSHVGRIKHKFTHAHTCHYSPSNTMQFRHTHTIPTAGFVYVHIHTDSLLSTTWHMQTQHNLLFQEMWRP